MKTPQQALSPKSLYRVLESFRIVVFCVRVRIRFPSYTIIHIKWTDLGSDPGTRKAQKVPALSEHDKSTSNPRIASFMKEIEINRPCG